MAVNNAADAALRLELQTDPLTRGYAGLTDAQIRASLRAVDRPGPWLSLSTAQIQAAIAASEFNGLSDTALNKLRVLMSADSIETAPGTFGRETVASIFGVPSATVTALVILARPPVSRATELGIPDNFVSAYHINVMR